MKRHVALTLLLLTALGVLNAHVDLPRVDGRSFVMTQGKMYDPIGWTEDVWTSATRRCSEVHSVSSGEGAFSDSLAAIRAFSPPDSQSAQFRQLQTQGNWLLAEVEFEALSPAVVALQRQGEQIQVAPRAIWSGDTQPWRPAPLIRRHLQGQAAEIPSSLLDCFKPQGSLFLRD